MDLTPEQLREDVATLEREGNPTTEVDTKWLIELGRAHAAALEQNDKLAARVGELETDAERLEWIEKMLFDKHWNGVIDSGSKTHWRIGEGYRHVMREMVGHTFRSAIDAARSKP